MSSELGRKKRKVNQLITDSQSKQLLIAQIIDPEGAATVQTAALAIRGNNTFAEAALPCVFYTYATSKA